MSDFIDVGATIPLQYGQDPVAEAQRSALAGQQIASGQIQLGQQRGALSALNGVDLTDPNSVDAAMQASLKAGALSQASALSDLQYERATRASYLASQQQAQADRRSRAAYDSEVALKGATSVLAPPPAAAAGGSALSGVGGTTPATAATTSALSVAPSDAQGPDIGVGRTPAPPPAASGPSPGGGTPSPAVAVSALSALPAPAASKAAPAPAAAAAKPGVTPAPATTPVAAITPPTPAQPNDQSAQSHLPDVTGWTIPQRMDAIKRIGTLDQVEQQLSQLPYEQRKAALQAAGPQLQQLGFSPDALNAFDPTDANIAAKRADIAEAHDHFLTGGNPPPPPTAEDEELSRISALSYVNPAAAAQQLAVFKEQNPDMVEMRGAPGVIFNPHTGTTHRVVAAEAIAAQQKMADEAKAQVTDKRTLIPVTNADGSVTQVRADQIAGQPPGVTYGTSQTPLKAAADLADMNLLADTEKRFADPQHISDLTQRAQSAQMALNIASNLKAGKATVAASEVDQILGALHIASPAQADFATKAELLEQGLSQQILNSFQNTKNVRNQREFNLIASTVGQVTDPASKLQLSSAAAAYAADRERQYGGFVTDWLSKHPLGTAGYGQAALDKAWQQGPGSQSMFMSPYYRNMVIDGRPAVTIQPKPAKDGHIYGIFMPGTAAAQPFRAQ